MPLLTVSMFETGSASSSSGVSMSQGETRGKQFFRIGFTAAAQEELFGRTFDLEKDGLQLIVTNDKNLNHLIGFRLVDKEKADALPMTSSARGSCSLRVKPWRAVSAGKRKAVQLAIVNRQVQGGGISAKLPDWARPEVNLKPTP